ncbi:4426_t:CDS:1 [Cetraspora pellucida]|uniref:4426_t:CDS:1 n=1 Tax=Cetraspora pellucida TaxID=1433469 RepID=A0A9N9D5S6_9GLOM|nr:4426_t:CDS:1 [Cetraspora pellucida]
MSLINHKKAYKNNYNIESETGTSIDTYSSDNSDLISNNQADNESSPAFDIQSTSSKLNLTFNNQNMDNNESSSTSGKSNLVFNNQKIIDEFDSIFDNQEISNQILTYEFAEIFERTILENKNNIFIDKIYES